jgi:hypothetical protein
VIVKTRNQENASKKREHFASGDILSFEGVLHVLKHGKTITLEEPRLRICHQYIIITHCKKLSPAVSCAVI